MLWFCWDIFSILTIFNKTYNFKNMSFRFSINSSKHVHFWTLILKTILCLIKFPFQRYINCRPLNFDLTYENGHHGDFLPFWKSGILGFCGLQQNFSGNHRATQRDTRIFFSRIFKNRIGMKIFENKSSFRIFPAALKKNHPC